jgi:hypothetical protein
LETIFGPKREEAVGWSKLHIEDLLVCTDYYVGGHIEVKGMGRVYSVHGKVKIVYKILDGKPEGK